MSGRALSTVPAEVKRLAGRLEAHRQRQGKGRRIPEEIWRTAASLAQEHGVSVVAQALRLDYYKLKERAAVEEYEGCSPGAFLEFRAAEGALGASQCAIELETAGGHKMTMRLPALSGEDALELATAFWRWSS